MNQDSRNQKGRISGGRRSITRYTCFQNWIFESLGFSAEGTSISASMREQKKKKNKPSNKHEKQQLKQLNTKKEDMKWLLCLFVCF